MRRKTHPAVCQTLCSLALLLVLPGQSWSADDWFGTITITQTRIEENVEKFPPGHAYYPGQEAYHKKEVWKGAATYLPDKIKKTEMTYEMEEIRDRSTKKTFNCLGLPARTADYSDIEKHEWRAQASGTSERRDNLNPILIKSDGYRKTISIGVATSTGNKHFHHVRETSDGCRPPVNRFEESSDSTETIPPVFSFEIAGNANPSDNTLSGSIVHHPDNKTELVVSWNLTRETPLVAVINARDKVKRVESITLDGSKSTGKIDTYSWQFLPGPECNGIALDGQFEMKGPKVQFKVLCGFDAILTVQNSHQLARQTFHVDVIPRAGPEWKTSFKAERSPKPLSAEPLSSLYKHFGLTHCKLDNPGNTDYSRFKHDKSIPFEDRGTGHYLHLNTKESPITQRGTGYWIDQVKDGGPFNSMWYVDRIDLRINLVEQINSDLVNKGSRFYKLNLEKNNEAAVLALREAVEAHESMHSTMAKEEIQRTDPGEELEKFHYPVEILAQTYADQIISDANERLTARATDEKAVKERLRATGKFNKEITLWLPENGSGKEQSMGPLWSIGDD